MELADEISKHVVGLGFDDLPGEAVEGTKQVVLDQFATALAGTVADGAVEVVAEVLEWGGKPESTIWGYGDRVPAAHAAFANAVMAHAWDFDDTHMPSICHTGVVTVPTAFALAERIGKVSGKELITAINAGIDVQVRLSMGASTSFGQGWHPTSLFGGFGAAVTAGSLMKLNEEQMVNALGIMYGQSAGNLQNIADGVLTKRIQPGFQVRAGINSVMLALRGVTGVRNVFEGVYGLYPLYMREEYDRNIITSGLGERFETGKITIKPHPGCILSQPFESAAIDLVKANDIKAEEVESMQVYCGTKSFNVPGAPVKKHPKSIVDAQFSTYYKLANAVIRRRSSAKEYTMEAIRDEEVLKLAQKVELTLSPEFDTESHSESGGKLVIKTTRENGIFSTDIHPHKGRPENPMSWEDMLEKYQNGASMCVKPITQMNLSTLANMVKTLEQVDNVNQMMRLIVGKKKLTQCMG
jgi:2-methylcitrate dehydratase PrpD